jgi:protein dithiol oxidoreductase (disulfide-forming)
MVKSLLKVLFLVFLTHGLAMAAGGKGGPEGEGYELVEPPQPTSDPNKVEVIEFFWYGCPHCYHFEPDINAWLKTKPANVVFIRQPAIFNAHWAAHAKAFFTAEALGVLDKLHADFYKAIQNQKMTLESEDDLAKFFAEHGVKEADFHKAYKSFAVDTKLRQAEGLAARYGVTGTPSLIVNGKYRVSGTQAKTFANMIAVTNTLIRKESEAKPGK